MDRTRRGTSRLLGALLFVAVSLAAAAILTGWMTATELRADPAVTTQCSHAGIDIFSARYNASGDVLAVAVTNAGTVGLDNVTVAALQAGTVRGSTDILRLRRGGLQRIRITDLPRRPDRVQAVSVQCPDVTARTTDIEAAG